MNKISVKVELEPDHDIPDLEIIEEAFAEALDIAGFGFDDEILDKFFTMRFDELPGGGIAATVSVAEKRD